MTRRSGIGLAAVLALVVGLLLVALEPWSTRGGATTDRTAASSSGARNGTGSRTDELVTPSSGRARAAGQVQAVKGEAPQRVLATDLAVQTGELRPVRIVVNGGVPGGEHVRARVLVGAHAMLDWGRHPRDKQRERAERGEPFVPDEHGRVFVPRIVHAVRVVGETSAHWGYVDIEPGSDADDEIVLRLERVPILWVRVVDSAGAPAGGVEVVALTRGGRETPVETDANGLARFVDADVLSPAFGDPGARAEPVDLRVDVPVGGPPHHRLDGIALPAEPVELALPPCGSLAFELTHVDGTPWAIEEASLRVWEPPEQAPTDERAGIHGYFSVEIRDGRGALPRVEVDRRFRAEFEADGLGEAPLFDFAGPTRVGEVARVAFAPAELAPVVTARLVDARRAPLANTDVKLLVLTVHPPANGRPARIHDVHFATTDEAGGIVLQLPGDREGGLDGETWRLDVVQEDGKRGARIPLPADLPPGITDLGAIAVRSVPVVVAGIVRNADGEPVPGADVFVDANLFEDRIGGEWLSMEKALELERTRVLKGLATTRLVTDDAGRFELRGFTPESGTLVLAATRSRYARTESAPVPVGATDVELVLHGIGALRVRTWSDEALSPDKLGVRARLADGDERNFIRRAPRQGADGTWTAEFEIKNLAAIPVDVEVFVRATGEVLRVLAAVPVRAEDARPDTIDPIDLRGVLRPREVHVLVDGDRPADDVSLAWHRAGDDPDLWIDEGGSTARTTILTAAPSIDVCVTAIGYRAARLDALAPGESRKVVLKPGASVHFVVPAAAQLPSGLGAHLRLDRAEAPWIPRSSRSRTVGLDSDGEWTDALDPGTYRVRLYLKSELEGIESRWLPDLESGLPVTVADASSEQTLVLDELSALLSDALRAPAASD